MYTSMTCFMGQSTILHRSQCLDPSSEFNPYVICVLSFNDENCRNDPRLFKDDVDIRFSRTLNSCKLPQIRYASPSRLFERLTDLRFLSIDFLNTFLLTYRVFTDGVTVLEALKRVHYNPDPSLSSVDAALRDSSGSLADDQATSGVCASRPGQLNPAGQAVILESDDYDFSRRISTISTVSDSGMGETQAQQTLHTSTSRHSSSDRSSSAAPRHRDSTASAQEAQNTVAAVAMAQAQARNSQHWRLSYRKCKYYICHRHIVYFD